MGKIKKFTGLKLSKSDAVKDPVKLIEKFIEDTGFDPAESLNESTSDTKRWVIEIAEDVVMEILLEALQKPTETSVYMGINVAVVPVRNSSDFLAASLEVADGLIGVKISLVGHFLVMSVSAPLSGLTLEDLQYNYMLITTQAPWYKEALATELDWESLPDY